MNRGKLNIYGLGGAGINVVGKLQNELETLVSEDTCDIVLNTLDTSKSSISKYPNLSSNFTLITTDSRVLGELDGTGGERKNIELVKSIKKSIQKRVDDIKDELNDVHVLIFSGSGGSGSLIAPLMLTEMMNKDMTVISIFISDTSNLLYCNNTINTILSLHAVAKNINKALVSNYVNNNHSNVVTTTNDEEIVNKDILKILKTMMISLSESIKDIDLQDMKNFFSPSKYKTFNIAPGLYRFGYSFREEKSPDTLLLRTLSDGVKDIEISGSILHNKTGVLSEGQIGLIGENSIPIYMKIEKNFFNKLVATLKERHSELESLKKIESDELDSLIDSEEFGDGLVL